jgi:erythromycin esterase-like protein
MPNSKLVNTLQNVAVEFETSEDLKELIAAISGKKIVMLGEASHGTHEYYNWRARVTKQLMENHGFDFMAVEGDWPPCYHLNRHIKGYSDAPEETHDVLQNFERWPSWMWANWEIEEWSKWLRKFNQNLPANKKRGFYGLDVYSLWESLQAIMDYLEDEDPTAFRTAKSAMKCFEPYSGEGQEYALSTRFVPEGCRKEVTDLLTEIMNKSHVYNSDREHVFSTQQNAITASNAEEYYRRMVSGGNKTWNLRDEHMMDTLDRLLDFHGDNSKAVVWAHNTHIGDASYTDMAGRGLFNIGELARKRHGRNRVALVGFGSYQGSVLAGDAWGEPVEEMNLPAGRPGSWEEICHEAGNQFWVLSDDIRELDELRNPVPHRAVGVVYHPERERYGNYVPTTIPKRYDAFLFFDESQALNHIPIGVEEKKVPETYPFGL